MPRKKNKKARLVGLVKLEILDRFTPSIIKKLSNLLKNCWEHPVHIPYGKWFIIKKSRSVLAAGQLDENNTLWNLCTNKKYRANGFARKIIHAMLNKICREKGVMSLFVDSSSPKSWYERLGFETTMMDEEERLKYAHRPDVEKMSRYACSFKRHNSFSFNDEPQSSNNATTPGGPMNVSFRMKKEELQQKYQERYGARDAAMKNVLGDQNLVNLLSELTGEAAVSTAASKAGKEARQQGKKQSVLRDQGMRLMQNALDSIFSSDDQISETAFKQFKSYVDPPSSENPGNYDLLSPEVVVKSVSDKNDITKGSLWRIPKGYKKLTDYYTTHTDSDGDEWYNITKSDHSTYSKPGLYTANISPQLRRERLFVYISYLLRNVSAYPVKIDSPIIKLVEEELSGGDWALVSKPVTNFLTHYLDNALDGAARTEYVKECIKKFNERLDKIKVCLGKIVVDPGKSLSFSVDDSISIAGMRDPEGYEKLGKFRENREPPIEFVIRIPSDFMFQYLIDRGADLGYKDQYGQDVLFMITGWGTIGQLKLLYEHYKKKFGASKAAEFIRGEIDDSGKRYPNYDAHCKPSNANGLTFGPSLTEELFHKRGSDSPLLIAAFKCRLDIVKELVNLAVTSTSTQAQRYNFMNQRNAHLVTPLLGSMYQNICGRRLEVDSNYDLLPAKQVELFKFLVENGADPNLGEQISGKAGDYSERRKLEASTGAREYNKNTPLEIALFEQRFGNFDMSVEWARLLVDQGASVLQLDNDKRLITFSTKEARAKNKEWTTIQEQEEEEGKSGKDGITWSVAEIEMLGITVNAELAETTDYIPIVCKSNTVCRPVTEKVIEDEIYEGLYFDPEMHAWAQEEDGEHNERDSTRPVGNVTLGLYISYNKNILGSYTRMWGGGSFGGSSGIGILDEENNGRYPKRNFSSRKKCEEEIRIRSENDIVNWLIDKAGSMGDPRINSLLESIKHQIADIGSKTGVLQSKWRQSISRVPKINWLQSRFMMNKRNPTHFLFQTKTGTHYFSMNKFSMNKRSKKHSMRRKKSIKKRSVRRKKSKKRSMRRKKSIKKSSLRKPAKNRRKRISLKDLNVRPIRDVEAGKVPIFAGRGHNVTISGLINCIGVIITQYSPQTGAPVSVIAGHFETPTMYDSAKHTLTKSGEKFASRIVNLINDKINADLQTTVQFVYGDSNPGRIVSSNVIGKLPKDTGKAFIALRDNLGLHHVKLEPVVGRNKSKITIRIPH